MSDWRPLRLRYSDEALKALQRIEVRRARLIRAKARRYADTGHGDVKRLQGPEGFRLRVGDWPVIFEVDGDELVMLVLRVAPRGGAYER